MEKETGLQIERLAGEALGKTVEIDGVTYATRTLHDPREEESEPGPLDVRTLLSLVDYIRSSHDEYVEGRGMFVHVETPTEVSLRTGIFGPFHQRARLALATFVTPVGFKFGRFYEPEEFNIALQSHFLDTEGRAKVLQIVGTIRDDAVRTLEDDGVTQTVSARAGLKLTVPVPNPVKLAPFRTFPEVDQPVSPFILRMRGGGDGALPECALFEADGGAWRLDAVGRLKAWLDGMLGKTDDAPQVDVFA